MQLTRSPPCLFPSRVPKLTKSPQGRLEQVRLVLFRQPLQEFAVDVGERRSSSGDQEQDFDGLFGRACLLPLPKLCVTLA